MVNSKPPVFLFIGSDNYLKDKALEELSSSLLDSSSKKLDYKVFYGSDADIREVLDYANTIPFSATKKVVVVKDVEKLPREDRVRLITYIKKPVDSTCLVLQSSDESLLEEDSALSQYVSIRRFGQMTDRELGAWIERFLKSKSGKKSISADAIEVLKELQGQNLLSLDQELEKLITFVGARDEIKPDDVEAIVGRSLMAAAFDLTAAIEKKDVSSAMRVIADLALSGKKHYEIVGLLCWYLRRMMKARVLRDRGESDSSIAGALRLNRRYADEFFDQLEALNIDQIKSGMNVLLEADLDLKRTKYDPALILEFAVLRLCLL